VLTRLFKAKKQDPAVRSVYARIVEQARKPAFYSVSGVPDTLDGRFEMIALHAFLVLHRLKRDRHVAADFAQALFDMLFLDMDTSLRELGAGDLGVGRRVKAMAKGFYGRVAAYEAGVEQGHQTMAAALRRNLYGTVEPRELEVRAMAHYVIREAAGLATQDHGSLMAGRLVFGAPPDGDAAGGRAAMPE
jgi:cytochrome b pre-mRNA-processing protein 3